MVVMHVTVMLTGNSLFPCDVTINYLTRISIISVSFLFWFRVEYVFVFVKNLSNWNNNTK